LPSGSIELIKWFALVLMTGDHVNKYLYNGTFPFLYEAGRVAMPLFVFVSAFNLARPDALQRGVYGRCMVRLGLVGLPAAVPLRGLVSAGWWPLNIMFTLLAITAILYLMEHGGPARVALRAGDARPVPRRSVWKWHCQGCGGFGLKPGLCGRVKDGRRPPEGLGLDAVAQPAKLAKGLSANDFLAGKPDGRGRLAPFPLAGRAGDGWAATAFGSPTAHRIDLGATSTRKGIEPCGRRCGGRSTV
jgi:hypothetical protein